MPYTEGKVKISISIVSNMYTVIHDCVPSSLLCACVCFDILPQAFFVLVNLSAVCSKERKWSDLMLFKSDEVSILRTLTEHKSWCLFFLITQCCTQLLHFENGSSSYVLSTYTCS